MQVTYNSTLLNSLGLKLRETNHTNLASKSFESIKVAGRTGHLIIDDGSFNNKKIELKFIWDLRKEQSVKAKIKQLQLLLQGHVGYKDLSFSDGFAFNAIVEGDVVFIELANNLYEVNIVFDSYEKEV